MSFAMAVLLANSGSTFLLPVLVDVSLFCLLEVVGCPVACAVVDVLPAMLFDVRRAVRAHLLVVVAVLGACAG